ncbi:MULTISPECIES: recombinase family protein [Bacillus]|uniref:recombinase family protein n=1 Tax=Bacillus TaxID=1386 RepID=UPI001C81B5C5|nr:MULTISPECIES: recombinase family protein [Bacillus]BCC56656.1 recombinase family protein [Bacillus cereus]
MQKIGYARVSSKDQLLDSQLMMLEEYGCDEIITEKVTGVAKDRKLFELVERMEPGDKLIIVSINRLGRSTLQSIALAEEMRNKGLELVILEHQIDTTTTNGKLFFEIMCSFADWERSNLKEKQERGIQAARLKGKHLGKPRQWTKSGMEEAVKMYEEERIVSEIVEITKVSRAALYRELKKRGITRT